MGFLGPNGAGKTTTIRLLLGLIQPTSGQAFLFGDDVARHGKRLRKDVGYLPGDVRLYRSMRGDAFLNFMARARGLDCHQEIKRLVDKFSLDTTRRIGTYSTGMRQKLGLIQALMHQPRLLILDEPTSALDPLIRQHVFAELRSVVRAGRSVLFSSHSISEVETLCDEVIMLKDGQILTHEPIDILKGRALKKVEVKLAGHACDSMFEKPNIKNVVADGDWVRFHWDGPIGGLTDWLACQDLDDAIVAKPDLNALFMSYYENLSNYENDLQDSKIRTD